MLDRPALTGTPPLDIYKAYLDAQLVQALAFYQSCVGLLASFKWLQRLKPREIEYVDVGSYDRCGTWDNKPCSCKVQSAPVSLDKHYLGKPKYVDVALKVPVSTVREWLYNRCALHCWKWSLRIMTDSSFLEEARRRPELYYDMFVYPVNTEYLTPQTTKAAVYRWLKISCPKLNYNIALVSKDPSCLPKRT